MNNFIQIIKISIFMIIIFGNLYFYKKSCFKKKKENILCKYDYLIDMGIENCICKFGENFTRNNIHILKKGFNKDDHFIQASIRFENIFNKMTDIYIFQTRNQIKKSLRGIISPYSIKLITKFTDISPQEEDNEIERELNNMVKKLNIKF